LSWRKTRGAGLPRQETWVMRALLTTGDFRWRSANLSALPLSV